MLVDECDKQCTAITRRRRHGLCCAYKKKRAHEPFVRPSEKPRRLRPHDVSVLLQRKASTLYAAVPHLRLRQNISESRLKASLSFERSDVPPIAEIEGVDLVTEGVITINKVIEYAEDALGDNEKYGQWSVQRDGASLIARMLFEEATDINFLWVGRSTRSSEPRSAHKFQH